MSKRPRRSGVKVETVETEPAAPSTSATPEALYGVAMLKIALEVKRHASEPLDSIISRVLTQMRLPEGAFRDYLASNGGLLKAIAEKRKL